MDWPIGPSDIFPILDRAGEDIAHLLAFEIADWAARIHDDGHAIGPDYMIRELDVASLCQFQFILDWLARSRSDVTLACHESGQAVSGQFWFQLKRCRGMVLLEFGDEPWREFFANSVGAFDDNFPFG